MLQIELTYIYTVLHFHMPGVLPQEIGNLRSLQELNMEHNQIMGTLPATVFNMSSLQKIVLSNNSLSGPISANICHHLPKLEELFLDENNLHGEILRKVLDCSALRILSLGQNNLIGSIPRDIGNLRMLEILHFSDNNIGGTCFFLYLFQELECSAPNSLMVSCVGRWNSRRDWKSA